MKINEDGVCLVTGASSGIGLACARLLRSRGFKVYGTSRGVAAGEVADKEGILMIGLDVTSESSVKNAVSLVIEREGRIDLLVNNAGAGVSGSVEEISMQDAQFQMDVCFFGCIRMIKYILPQMRKNGGGRIINIGSVAASISIPYQIIYSAAKASLRSLTAGLRLEAAPFGVEVCEVDPGDTRTGFTAERKKPDIAPDSPYAERYLRSLSRMEHDEQNGASPEKVARAVLRAVLSRKMKPRVTVGFSYKVIDLLKRLLPEALTEKIIAMLYA